MGLHNIARMGPPVHKQGLIPKSADDINYEHIFVAGPMVVTFLLGVVLLERILGENELKPLVYGGSTFLVAWALHLAYCAELRRILELGEISGDAFGTFTTLLGLIFSLQLGQTYSYYFDRQGAIQDAAFREISALQRLLELCLSFFEWRSILGNKKKSTRLSVSTSSWVEQTEGPEHQHGRAMSILKHLEEEVASLAPGGEGLLPDTSIVCQRRALKGLLQHLNALSADDNTENDPATIAALTAAQNSIDVICEARAMRVSQINADLPPAQFLTLNVLGGLLLGSFLLSDLKNDQLEAALFGALAGAAALFKCCINDLANPFTGSWSVEPARKAGKELLAVVREEIESAAKAQRER